MVLDVNGWVVTNSPSNGSCNEVVGLHSYDTFGKLFVLPNVAVVPAQILTPVLSIVITGRCRIDTVTLDVALQLLFC